MRLLILTKRQYMGKDLVDDRFGRFRELSLELARLGHEVKGICLSYRPKNEGLLTDSDNTAGIQVPWHSLNLGYLMIPGLFRYYFKAMTIARQFSPDLIWSCSDAFHSFFGVFLARHLITKCVVDLYDNFESYGATRIPGVLSLFKSAVKNADGVTCVSQALADHVVKNYHRKGLTMVLENAVRKDLFYPQDRKSCRRNLGLPESAKIIGTAGALYQNRGTKALFDGFKLLTEADDNLHLVIAGPRDRRSQLPRGPRVHDLGVLPLEKVPLLFNALDVAVICNRDSSFGRYCFPQKAYEIIACGTPVVAANVGPMKNLLDGHREWLFEPENPQSCAEAIGSQLNKPTPLDIDVPSWPDFSRQLERFFTRIGTFRHAATSDDVLEVSEDGRTVQK